jgi:acid phosphatase
MVVVVMEENHGFDQVIGPSSPMPFLNSLMQRGSLLTQYFADAHPSLPNYLELTSGAIETFDDNFSGVISNDNLARELSASGKSWKAYAEDLPSAGYLGGDTGNYAKRHNPFAYFSDVVNSSAQSANIVPFTQFSSDMSNGALPSFSFVVPDLLDDAHSCPDGPLTCTDTDLLSRADQWLNTNISPLLSSSQFQNNGVLLILFDEAEDTDIQHGGGHVALVAVGPKVKAGFQSTVFYQHENTLRTICDALAVQTCPGAGATASSEGDIFQP